MSSHSITWFEIAVTDLDRAQKFYETVLAITLRREQMYGAQMAVFPGDETSVTGCLQQGPMNQPANVGTTIYLSAGQQLDEALARVPNAGGRVSLAKTALPPGMGYFAHIVDTEGNRVGLHGI